MSRKLTAKYGVYLGFNKTIPNAISKLAPKFTRNYHDEHTQVCFNAQLRQRIVFDDRGPTSSRVGSLRPVVESATREKVMQPDSG